MVFHNIIPVRLLQIAKIFGLIASIIFYTSLNSSVDASGSVEKQSLKDPKNRVAYENLLSNNESTSASESNPFHSRLLKLLEAENPNKNNPLNNELVRAFLIREVYLSHEFVSRCTEWCTVEYMESLLKHRSNAPKNYDDSFRIETEKHLIETAAQIALNSKKLDDTSKLIKQFNDVSESDYSLQQIDTLENTETELNEERKKLFDKLYEYWFAYNPATGIFDNCDNLFSAEDQAEAIEWIKSGYYDVHSRTPIDYDWISLRMILMYLNIQEKGSGKNELERMIENRIGPNLSTKNICQK